MIAAATPHAYSGTLECVQTIWREDGLAGFFHGAMANVARALVSSLTLILWDQLIAILTPPPPPPPQQGTNLDDVE